MYPMTAPKAAPIAEFLFEAATAATPKGAIFPKRKDFEAAKQTIIQSAMLKKSGVAALSIFGIFTEIFFVLTSVIL
jgi:hypothetical protein